MKICEYVIQFCVISLWQGIVVNEKRKNQGAIIENNNSSIQSLLITQQQQNELLQPEACYLILSILAYNLSKFPN